MRIPLGLALSVTAACSGVAPDLTSMPQAAYEPSLSPADFPGAATLLSGFDERAAGGWHAGDQVLFGLRLRRGDTSRCWLLHLDVMLGDTMLATNDEGEQLPITIGNRQTWNYTVSEGGKQKELPISSNMLPVAVTVADSNGVTLGQSRVPLPADLLSDGLLPAVQKGLALFPAAGAGQTAREEDIKPLVAAIIGMMALLNVVQNDKVLSEYFWQVVEKPGVFSVIANFGVKVSIRMPFENSLPVKELPAHLPPAGTAFAVPLQVDVNGNPALLVRILAADPARPYALCGGMVAATARHPTDPALQFDVILLAAHRAQGEAKARIGLHDRPQ